MIKLYNRSFTLDALSGVLLVSLFAISPAYANIVGASSNTNNIVVNTSQYLPDHGNANEPGIRVAAAPAPYGSFTIGFNTLQNMGGIDQVIDGYKISSLNVSDMPPSHSQLGNFDIAQVPNQDVYFGEWTADRNNPTATKTVYYGGSDATTNMPTSGSATYTVKGMNHYDTSRLMTGSFNANFNTNKLYGYLADGVFVVQIIDNDINPSTASFAGTAMASAAGYIIGGSGHSEGHFFGDNAESLAGIATFQNSAIDTSFGGTRD